MQVDVVARKDDPQTVIVFIGQPKKDDASEKAEESAQRLPLFPALLGRFRRGAWSLDSIVALTKCENDQCANHQPRRCLKGDLIGLGESELLLVMIANPRQRRLRQE